MKRKQVLKNKAKLIVIKTKENKIELILLKNSSLENDLNHIETYYYD